MSEQHPLRDLVVLDFTLALAGPFATRLLAGLGARVVKIEAPGGHADPARANAPFRTPDGVSMAPDEAAESIPFLDRTRGKESITLDLKHPGAAAVVADLAASADLVVQNWSPGVAERLGVDHATLARHNPAIVVASITGFGLDASPEEVPTPRAMDSIIQAMSGFMLSAGAPSDPPVMNGVPIADLTAPLFAVIGALSAVHDARRTGRGRLVDVSMLGALTALVAAEPHGAYAHLGGSSRPGRSVARLAPFGLYPTDDGHVSLCAPTDAFAHRLLELIGEDDADPRFVDRASRVAHHAELDALIDRWAAARSTEEAVAALAGVGVPAAPVRTPAEAVEDPLVLRRGEVAPISDPFRPGSPIPGVVGPGIPIRFTSADPPGDDRSPPEQEPDLSPAPSLGQHNRVVYRDLLGYGDDDLDRLSRAGVI